MYVHIYSLYVCTYIYSYVYTYLFPHIYIYSLFTSIEAWRWHRSCSSARCRNNFGMIPVCAVSCSLGVVVFSLQLEMFEHLRRWWVDLVSILFIFFFLFCCYVLYSFWYVFEIH